MTQKIDKHLTSPLTALMHEMKREMIREDDAIQEDITSEFWKDIESRLAYFLPINIHIRGETATGKSTVGIEITDVILTRIEQLMKTRKYEKKIKELKIISDKFGRMGNTTKKFIFSDQTEFTRFIKEMWAMTCVVIDEYSRYASTGYSATTEEVTYAYYSDTFAQLFTHRILCSPATITDVNSYLVLDVLGTDLTKKTTKLKVSYRDVTDGSTYVLGHVVIDVSKTLKKKWYNDYREKKLKRFQLLAKHGKRDVRELEFDYIAMKIFEAMKNDAKVDRITVDEIEGELDITKRQEGRVYSILADQNIVRKVKTILGLYSSMHKAKVRYMIKADNAKNGDLPEELRALQKVIESKERRFEKIKAEYQKMSDLYTEFLGVR